MPLSRRQVYLRRRVAVFTTIGAVLAAGFYLPITLLAPLGPVAASVQQVEVEPGAAAELGWPGYGASGIGAVGYEGVLASSGSTTPVPIASITKVITALVVLDTHPLGLGEDGPEIAFTATDVAIRDAYRARNGKVAPVTPGLVLTQREVLDVMLLESANNYAESLATWAFGSETAFLPAASAWLAENGFTQTALSDSTGMSPANTSTPADLIGIGELAMANPVVAEIVGTRLDVVEGVGEIDNGNRLLGTDGIKGIKTGTLDEAGACLLFAADLPVGSSTVTVVGVVLGAADHASLNVQVAALLQDVREGFHELPLAEAGEVFGTYTTSWGATADAVAASSVSLVVWSDTPVSTVVATDTVRLAAAGTDIGDVVFSAGEQSATIDLELSKPIDDPGAWWRLTNPLLLF